MLFEIIIIGILGIFIGAFVGKFLFGNLKLFERLEQRKIEKIINNPENLKQRLEENGEIIDMGEKITFEIVRNSKGKKVINFERKKAKAEKNRIEKKKEPPKKTEELKKDLGKALEEYAEAKPAPIRKPMQLTKPEIPDDEEIDYDIPEDEIIEEMQEGDLEDDDIEDLDDIDDIEDTEDNEDAENYL